MYVVIFRAQVRALDECHLRCRSREGGHDAVERGEWFVVEYEPSCFNVTGY